MFVSSPASATTGPLRPAVLLIMLVFTVHLGLPGHPLGEPPGQRPSVSTPGDGGPGPAFHTPHETAWAAAHPQRPAGPYPEPTHVRHGEACQTLNPGPSGPGMAVRLLRCVSGTTCPAAGPVAMASPDAAVAGTAVLILLCVLRT
ncbi:hypothetical protein ACRYCC_30190 [Actinomadura scrupuli]|uniref:hypothetical protein n=1 Tax=Actinomadura scrupuli TaxID=559629 RepID=UPI003D97362C